MRFLAVLLVLAISLWAQSRPPFAKGEVLDYEISWGVVPAGTAQMRVDKNTAGSGYRLLALAKSKGYYEWAYRVRDTVVTWVQDDLRPTAFAKILNEGSWHNRQIVAFAPGVANLYDSVYTDTPPKGKLKRQTSTQVALDPGVVTHTVTSAFYAFRSLDLVKGKQYEFSAVSGKKKYKLKVIVHGYETVNVDAGRFDCAIVEPVLDGDGVFNSKGRLKIWISRDARRLPVKVESEIALGSISIELTKWKQNP